MSLIYFEQLKSATKAIAKLSLPIVISFVAMGLMGIVDTIVVGNYDTNELAYMGLANSVFVLLFTIPIGLLQGVLIKSSQHFGARKFSSTGKIYNDGKKYALLLSVIFTIIGLFGKTILTVFGQSESMATNSGEVLKILSFSIPFILIFVNANMFLQSIHRPHIAMYGIIIANLVNLVLDIVFVHGLIGMPEMGANGAALTTLVVRIFIALYLIRYIHRMKRSKKLSERFGLLKSYDTWWKDSKEVRKIGYGAAIMTIAGNGSFAMVSTFAGWMGEYSMAVFVIIMNIANLMFMICFSISQATSIVVARNYGKKDYKGISTSTIGGYIVSISVVLVLITITYIFPNQIFGIFSNDASILATINALIFYVLADLFIDVSPLNINGALSGCSDIKIPTIIQIISFLIIRIIACYILAFSCGLGLKGLPIGLAFGGASSLILNGARFIYLAKKNYKINH